MTDEIIEIHKIKVTPDLPIEAKREIAAWKKSSIYNQVFICVLEQSPDAKCKNCGDVGSIHVSFSRAGPFQNPPGHRVDETMRWFEGNEMAGKGWYIIKETRCYHCHRCKTEVL